MRDGRGGQSASGSTICHRRHRRDARTSVSAAIMRPYEMQSTATLYRPLAPGLLYQAVAGTTSPPAVTGYPRKQLARPCSLIGIEPGRRSARRSFGAVSPSGDRGQHPMYDRGLSGLLGYYRLQMPTQRTAHCTYKACTTTLVPLPARARPRSESKQRRPLLLHPATIALNGRGFGSQPGSL